MYLYLMSKSDDFMHYILSYSSISGYELMLEIDEMESDFYDKVKEFTEKTFGHSNFQIDFV